MFANPEITARLPSSDGFGSLPAKFSFCVSARPLNSPATRLVQALVVV